MKKNKIVLVILGLTAIFFYNNAIALEIWVSPSGSDSNPGTKEQPMEKILMAMRKARELRRLNDPAVEEGTHIILKGGIYQIIEPLLIRPEDSGTEDSPVWIEAAPGEHPVISSGINIINWNKITGTVVDLPDEAQGNIWVADVSEPGGRKLEFRQLWVNGKKAIRASNLYEGVLERILTVNTEKEEMWIPSPIVPLQNAPQLEFIIHQRWAIAILRVKEIYITGDSARIRFHQPESRIEFEHPWPAPYIDSAQSKNGNSAFYFANAIQLLNQPGEWYEDLDAGKVYYWPRKGEDLNKAEVLVPCLETLVKIEGSPDLPVSNMIFKGISFEHTTWLRPSKKGHVPVQAGWSIIDAYRLMNSTLEGGSRFENNHWIERQPAGVRVKDASHIRFERCRFSHMAASGLDFVRGTHHNLVEGCIFTDIGGTAIQLGFFGGAGFESHIPYNPSDKREVCQFEKISNNLITNCTNEDWGCVGVSVGYAHNINIEHNEVSHVNYSGICIGWGWTKDPNCMRNNRVHANHIHHFAKQMYDVGGIYTLSSQPGTEISNNSIHNLEKAPYAHDPEHYQYIYLDEGSSYIRAINNWTEEARFKSNSPGPGNEWINNGPNVSEEIKNKAGLEPEFKDLLKLVEQETEIIEITDLKCNFKNNPVGIDSRSHFSWILHSIERNQSQSAYYMLVSDDSLLLNKNIGNIWDTRKVKSEQSINVLYDGDALESGKEYFWKVKVWGKEGEASEWSKKASFVTALFNRENWHGAQWVGYEEIPDSLILVPGVHPWGNNVKNLALQRAIVPLFRKEFDIKREIKSAYLFVSGLGHYKAYINGQQISDDFLSPGWTDYKKTCLYNTYNITGHLLKGKNAIGVIVGNGFHNNNNERYKKLLITYGKPKMICLIRITYKDGTKEIIVSGTDWKTSPSAITYSSIYGGEDYDARLEQPGWNKPGFNDMNWQNALIVRDPGGILLPETAYPVKVMETFIPDTIVRLGTDTFLYDFGQNASGVVRLKVKGQKGQKIKLIPGELIDKDKFVNQRATGSPFYFEYTLRGDEAEIWQPLFTYYGFRYVQVEGAIPHNDNNNTDKPVILELKFLHTFSSTPVAGEFSCSSELFNRISNLILYAIRSNLQSVVTDCPHREKLGWLEQTYLMGGSIHYNFNLYHLYNKLVDDMIDAQTEDGLIPDIAPEYVLFKGGFRDSPEWGSAGIILPWLIYRWYGDKSVMVKAWPMMLKYIEYLGTKADGNILSHGLGDWYDLGPGRPGVAQLTPRELTATAIYYYDVSLMASMASILNYTEDEQRLIKLANEIKDAFNNKFFNAGPKVYSTGSQTAMAMPLCVGLVNANDQDGVFSNLIDIINQNGKALTAGDVGFHFLVEALTQGSASELIYEMNNRDDVPGYGYQLKKGATALTESWAALESVSNNHLMLGHIMEWFYKGLCGIQQEEGFVAYKSIVINPSIAGDFTEVKANYNSPYGTIKSEWERQDSVLLMDVAIPVNTTARIFIPATDTEKVFEGGKPLKDVKDIKFTGIENGSLVVETGSGNYRFEVIK